MKNSTTLGKYGKVSKVIQDWVQYDYMNFEAWSLLRLV